MTKLKKIELNLVVDHSSWWKKKKYRKESCEILLKHKNSGWKLSKILFIKKLDKTIDTRIFKRFFLYMTLLKKKNV